MNSNVKILKKRKISEVVVRPENIRELAEKVYKEYNQDLKKHQHVSIGFILKSSDGTQYESENMEIFSKGGILDNRRIVAIEMGYHNYSKDKRIYIDLEHTTSDWTTRNEVTVSGRDEIWANGVLKLIESIVSDWKKQVNWPHKYKWLLTIIFGIGIGLFFFSFLDFIFSFSIVVHERATKLRPLLIYFYCLSGLVLGFYIVSKIRKLYPRVEFIMGPDYSRAEEKKRIKLYKAILFVVIPLAISLIIELIRTLIR